MSTLKTNAIIDISGTGSTTINGSLPPAQIQSVTATVATNALTVGAPTLSLSFRSTTLTSGTISNVYGAPANLVVPNGATLGTTSAVSSRLAIIALNNAGTIELAIANASGIPYKESGLITTTAISTSSDSPTGVYSTTARTNVAYRVVGIVESTQATAGTWATAPSLVQGIGGGVSPTLSMVDFNSAQTLTNKTLTSPTVTGAILNDGYTEEVFAVTGTTPALSPTDGSIQTWTLSGNSTPTAGTWAAGQSITLMVDDGSARTITWTSLAVTWKTDGGVAPTLNTSGYTAIQLWKVSTTIYGARVGNA